MRETGEEEDLLAKEIEQSAFQAGVQELDGDPPGFLAILGQKDRSHPPLTEHLLNLEPQRLHFSIFCKSSKVGIDEFCTSHEITQLFYGTPVALDSMSAMTAEKGDVTMSVQAVSSQDSSIDDIDARLEMGAGPDPMRIAMMGQPDTGKDIMSAIIAMSAHHQSSGAPIVVQESGGSSAAPAIAAGVGGLALGAVGGALIASGGKNAPKAATPAAPQGGAPQAKAPTAANPGPATPETKLAGPTTTPTITSTPAGAAPASDASASKTQAYQPRPVAPFLKNYMASQPSSSTTPADQKAANPAAQLDYLGGNVIGPRQKDANGGVIWSK